MQTVMCSRCGKNVAVIFITKIDGSGESKNEGKPVDDIMNRFGISDDDLDNISGEAMNFLNGMEGEAGPSEDASSEEEGKTATFPFFGRLFGNLARGGDQKQDAGAENAPKQQKDSSRQGRHKYLDNYCIDLTARASEGKLDAMIRESRRGQNGYSGGPCPADCHGQCSGETAGKAGLSP